MVITGFIANGWKVLLLNQWNHERVRYIQVEISHA